jgi:transcriptional regulator with XRE-family HTH domain
MTKEEITTLKKKFGDRIQAIREKKNLSLLQVSYNCSIDDSKISKIEHGKFNVTLATIIELARGLDIHPSELLKGDFE